MVPTPNQYALQWHKANLLSYFQQIYAETTLYKYILLTLTIKKHQQFLSP